VADWFFPIEEAPVLVTVTHMRVARAVQVRLVAADTGDSVGIVGAGYKVLPPWGPDDGACSRIRE